MNALICRVIALLLATLLAGSSASAHEVNPAYLELREITPHVFEVTWKQPIKDGRRLRLIPEFPETCVPGDKAVRGAAASVVETWPLSCSLTDGRIVISGLERTLTDVFLRIDYLHADDVSSVLRPSAAAFDLSTPSSAAPLLAYFKLGVEHILLGYDHLLFVLGLCLLVRAKQLFTTITAFTIAHSVTLALATLGNVTLPGPPVEAVIALSLILLGREALTLQAGKPTLTAQYPWLVAFGFGLIHGFGFAGALENIGLPETQEAWALLLFNIGVEFGQITFVAVVFAAIFAARLIANDIERIGRALAAYCVGIAGTIWMIERITSF